MPSQSAVLRQTPSSSGKPPQPMVTGLSTFNIRMERVITSTTTQERPLLPGRQDSLTGNVSGDFKGSDFTNADPNATGAKGGALVNTDSLGTVSGNFLENTVHYDQWGQYAQGGALHNEGNINSLSGPIRRQSGRRWNKRYRRRSGRLKQETNRLPQQRLHRQFRNRI